MAMTRISGKFAISPDGSDAYGVTIRDGEVTSMVERHMVDTFRAANDRRAGLAEGIDAATEVDAETAAAVLAAVGEWCGETLDPTSHVVAEITED